MINNVNFFTIYEFLIQNVLKILPIIYQNKAKIPGKVSGLVLRGGKLY